MRTLVIVIAFLLAFAAPLAYAQTCTDGGKTCGQLCGTGTCTTAQGVTFSGQCAAVRTTTSATCKSDPFLIRCDSAAVAICSGGPALSQSCTSDAQCVARHGSATICVVSGSAGIGSCGTNWSACIKSCSDSTTTTTTTSTTTTT